MPREKKGRPIL